MNKEDKTTIKYFDLLIKNIDDNKSFSVHNILSNILNPESKEDEKLFFLIRDNVITLGVNKGYFKNFCKNKEWFELTDKGIDLKNLETGYNKFEKRLNKSEWYNEQWIGYLIAFMLLIFTVFQQYRNGQLNSDFDSLESERDSLKFELDSLKRQYSSDYNNMIVNKEIPLSDTLQTKN